MFLKNMLNKSKVTISIILLLLITIFSNRLYEIYLLNKNGVYVLGKLHSTSSGGDQGSLYEFKYVFKGKAYYKWVSWPLLKSIQKDSLMFFKILPNRPQVSKELKKSHVPKCFEFENIPKEGWQAIPPINCKD
jgi:hypothetical protein